MTEIPQSEISRFYERLKAEAEAGGYHLNPDVAFAGQLASGLLVNEQRYGYRSCPCRLAAGDKPSDMDIICPCEYRDADLLDYDACYCALYVSGAALRGERPIRSIPERRPPPEKRAALKAAAVKMSAGEHEEEWELIKPGKSGLPYPVWRCRVCGYLCAREKPPELCPVCKAKQDRFERFM